MWSFLQKSFKQKSRSFGVLLALSGAAHGGVCAFAYLLGWLMGSQRLVCSMAKTVRVTMRSSGQSFLNSGASSLPTASTVSPTLTAKQEKEVQVGKGASAPKAEPASSQVVNQKAADLAQPPVVEKKVPVAVNDKKNSPAKKPTPAPVVQKSNVKQPVKKSPPAKAAQVKPLVKKAPSLPDTPSSVQQNEVPLFSAFKRPSKEEPVVTAKKDEKPSVEAVKEAPARESNKAPKESVQQDEAVQKSPSNVAVPVGQASYKEPEGSASGNFSKTSGAEVTAPETVPFALEEGGLVDHEVVREIWRHYRKPPGFEEHEQFTFTFDIKGGKAVFVAPRGNEPLIVYTALKDAVLKATFTYSNALKRVELLIT